MPKRRYRKKIIQVKKEPTQVLYTHRSLVRFDNPRSGYPFHWACRRCIRVLLSENAARDHTVNCALKPVKPPPPPPPPKPIIKIEPLPRYICQLCNSDFSRATSLKSHMKLAHPFYTETPKEDIPKKKDLPVQIKNERFGQSQVRNAQYPIKRIQKQLKQEPINIKEEQNCN